MDIDDMAKMVLPLTTIKCANGSEWEGRLPAVVSTYLRECVDEIARLHADIAEMQPWVDVKLEEFRSVGSDLYVCQQDNAGLRAEVERLNHTNAMLRLIASASQKTGVVLPDDPEHPIRISRREAMELTLRTRRKVMERMTDAFLAALDGDDQLSNPTLG